MNSAAKLFDLTGRVAIVTGASRGIGAEIAEALGEAGARLVAVSRSLEDLEEAARRWRAAGIECVTHAADVGAQQTAEALVHRALEAYGRVDIVVNNAGTFWSAPAQDMPLEQWERVLRVNLTGAFLLSQAAAREMVRAGRGGRIINVTSVLGLTGGRPPYNQVVGYAAAKGGIVAMTRNLARQWAPYGILVNALAPGWFPTRLTERTLQRFEAEIVRDIPLGRVARPGEIKGAALLLASEAGSYITGQVLAVDGGLLA